MHDKVMRRQYLVADYNWTWDGTVDEDRRTGEAVRRNVAVGDDHVTNRADGNARGETSKSEAECNSSGVKTCHGAGEDKARGTGNSSQRTYEGR